MAQNYRITLLPGDGIGPEIMAIAVQVLKRIGEKFDFTFTFTEALIGGSAIDATGDPFPAATLEACKTSDSILLAAIVVTNGIRYLVINVPKPDFWLCDRA